MSREFRFQFWAALAYFIVIEALLVGAVLFWPTFEDNIPAVKALVPIEALKGIADQIEAAGVSAYVNGQHFFKGCNTVGMMAAVLFAMGAVAGEAQRGTLEIWLSRPLSRRRILSERYASGALAVIVPVFVSSATVPWLLGFVQDEMPLCPLMLSSVQESALLLAVYSLTFLYSALTSAPLLVALTMLLFLIFEFGLYMIQTVTHWSIFRLTDIEVFARIGSTHTLDWRMMVPLLAVSAVAFTLAQIAFARRTP